MRKFVLVACLLLLSAAPTPTPETPAQALFHTWLRDFNSGDTARIKAFFGAHLGDPDAMYALDVLENSGGFDIVRIEKDEPLALTVLLRERDFPEQQRLKIELESATAPMLKVFDFEPLALPGSGAIDATAALATKLAAKDKFAGVLVAARGSDILLAKSWGLVDRKKHTPISLDTPIFLASAGKMFTSVAVLQLVDAGKIGLDDPVGKYLPDYPNRDVATKVTIRYLLSHRGGTGDVGILARENTAARAKVRTIEDLIALNGARGPDFDPGSKFDYSNYGYILLGAVIEKVTGQHYAGYVANHIFKPAGMTRSGFPTLDHLQRVAVGYTTDFGKRSDLVANLDTLPWQGLSAGGGVASANDMLRFFRALKAGKLLSKARLAQATMQQGTPAYGFGFVVDPAAHSHWGHGGDAYGASLAFAVYPENDTIFLCMATREFVCNNLYFTYHFRAFGPPR